MDDVKTIEAAFKAATERVPRYLPSGLPANFAAIHRDQLARAPMRLAARPPIADVKE